MPDIRLEALKAAIVFSKSPEEFLLNLKVLLESPSTSPVLSIDDGDMKGGLWGFAVTWDDACNRKVYMDIQLTRTKNDRALSLHLFNWSFARVVADSKLATVQALHVDKNTEQGRGYSEPLCLLPKAWFLQWPDGVSNAPRGQERVRYIAAPGPVITSAFTSTRDAIARTKVCYFLLQYIKQSQTAAAADQFFARTHLAYKREKNELPQVTVRRLYRRSLSIFTVLLDETVTQAHYLHAIMSMYPGAVKESVAYNAELLRTEIGVAARRRDVCTLQKR